MAQREKRRTAADKKALKRFAEAWAAMVNRVEHMPAKDFSRLVKACGNLTQTNCWWAEYRVAEALRPTIEARLAAKKKRRVTSAGTAGGSAPDAIVPPKERA